MSHKEIFGRIVLRGIQICCFFVLLLMFGTLVFARNFTDTSGHLNGEAIDYLADKDVVQGYLDGSFGPNKVINRAEFLKILLESADIPVADSYYCFPDVKTEWFAPYVCTAKSIHIVDGYPDGFFRPENPVNLAEALKMTLEAYDADLDYGRYSNWYEVYFWFAKPKGILDRVQESIGRQITRGEMAQLIFNLDEYYDKGAEQKEGTQEKEETEEKEPTKVGEKGCYVSDSLRSYVFDVPSQAGKYPVLVSGVSSEEDCRSYAIQHYVTDEKLTMLVHEGDMFTLANNITIRVKKIRVTNNFMSLTVEHFLHGKPLSTTPITHLLYYESDNGYSWNENYGYRAELLSLNSETDFVLEFTPLTPFIQTPFDLYRDCYFNLNSTNSCYYFSLFAPLPGEVELKIGNFVLFGDKDSEDYLEGVGEQLEMCYQETTDILGIETDFEDIPVHFLSNDSSGVVVTNNLGLKWPYFGVNNNLYEGEVDCVNNTAAHELVHAVVRNTPLSDILNEGLATFVSHKVVNTSDFSCENSGYNLYGEFHEFGDLNAYTQIPYREGGSDLYWTSACFWEEYYEDLGVSNFLNTMKLLADNRDYSAGGSVIELIENGLGIDLSSYEEKYGFNATTPEYPYEGRAERYAIFLGSTGSRWDGDYSD